MFRAIALIVIGFFMVAPKRASSNPVGPFPTVTQPVREAPNYWERGLSTLTIVSLFDDCIELRKTSTVQHQEEVRDYCACLAMRAEENALQSKYSDGDTARSEWGLRGSDFAVCSAQTTDASFEPRTHLPYEAREEVEQLRAQLDQCVQRVLSPQPLTAGSDQAKRPTNVLQPNVTDDTSAAIYCGCAIDAEARYTREHGQHAPAFRSNTSRFCGAAAEYYDAIRTHLSRSESGPRFAPKPPAQ